MKAVAFTVGSGVLLLGIAHCGGGSTIATGGDAGDGGALPVVGPPPASLGVPAEHRATADACPSQRPAGFNDPDAGAGSDSGVDQCAHDSDCTQGTNGRCLPQARINGHFCSYDTCANDSTCASGAVCQCGKSLGQNGSDGTPMRTGNACLPGDCRTDADCGAGGYCSPTFNVSCGAYSGVVGYYCHTANDECTRDDQCSDGGRAGYCAYDPTVAKWACEYSICAG